MKYKLPAFLQDARSPETGERALREAFPKKTLIGIDEVGRGPLAGPVVSCAVVLSENAPLEILNDSKKMSRKRREEIFEKVKQSCLCYSIASASVEEIDSTNILEANFLSMRRALFALGVKSCQCPLTGPAESRGKIDDENVLIAVDGNLCIRGVEPSIQLPIVKGDSLVASISAASILAKVFRDSLMDSLGDLYPGYGFEKNAGYGTKAHLEAIRVLGFSPVHRKTFRPKSLPI